MIDVTKIKSAKIISGAENIRKAIADQAEKSKGGAAGSVTTFVNQHRSDESGQNRLGLSKQSGLLASGLGYTMPDSKSLKDLADGAGVPWLDSYDGRVVPWFCSDERVDRHGDIVEQSWDFGNFKNNPLMLFSHNWDSMPIGNMIHWSVVNRAPTAMDNYAGQSLLMLGLFATQEQNAFADSVFRLVKAGFLKTVSVGFYAGEVIDVQDQEERNALGLGPWGYIFRNNELIELSPTSVPANPGAYQILNRAKAAGILQSSDVQMIRELKRTELIGKLGSYNQDIMEHSWKALDAQLCAYWKALYPEMRTPKHEGVNETVLMQELERQAPLAKLESSEKPELEKAVESALKQMNVLSDTVSNLSVGISEVRDLMELNNAASPKNLQKQKGGETNQGDSRVGALATLLSSPQGA